MRFENDYHAAAAKGGKLWGYNYDFQHKKYVLPLGKYPALSLEGRGAHKKCSSSAFKEEIV